MRGIILSVALAWIGASTAFDAHAHSFYVLDRDTNRLTHTDNGDPASAEVEEWQIRMYKAGLETGGPDYTGLYVGPTIDSVVSQLRWAQKIDRLFATETGIPNTPDTPFGPIAILKSATPHLQAPTLARLKELWDRLIRSSEIPGELSNTILGKSDKNPFAGVGEATKEYFNNLHDAVERVKAFQTQTETGILSDDSISEALNGLTTEVTKVEEEAKNLSQNGSNKWMHTKSTISEDIGGLQVETSISADFEIKNGLLKVITTERSPTRHIDMTDEYSAQISTLSGVAPGTLLGWDGDVTVFSDSDTITHTSDHSCPRQHFEST